MSQDDAQPETDDEFVAAIAALDHEVLDYDEYFEVRRRSTGATTRLEADEWSDALFEAWSLVKEE
jgi:hypothetical protein